MATIQGDGTNETLTGTEQADTINGGGGNDVLNALGGNDILNGEAGDDTLNGGDGNDTAVFSGAFTRTVNAGVVTVSSADGTDTLNGIEFYQVQGQAGRTLFVDTGGSIQEAIDRAESGDTIIIAAGTYAEQLTISGKSNITITAADGAEVIVQAPADGLDVNAFGEAFGEPTRAVIAIVGSTGITISDITVDGNYETDGYTPGTDEIAGVAVFGSSATLDTVVIEEVGFDPASSSFGVQRGVGLYIDGEDAAAGDNASPAVTVTNSTIRAFNKTGVFVDGVVLTFNGNAVTGNGATGGIAQNGIQIGGSEGSISGNTISGLGYDQTNPNIPDFTASGIIAYEPTGPLAITGNNFVGTGAGPLGAANAIELSDSIGQVFTVTGNTISGFETGIRAVTFLGGEDGLDTNPVISGNSFSNNGLNIEFDPEQVDSGGDPFTTDTDFNLTGSDGDDTLAGSDGDDTFNGAGGNDTLRGRDGNDSLSGGEGNDNLDGGAGTDTLDGDNGDDTFTVSDGDTVTDSGGNDTINTTNGNFVIAQGSVIETINNTSTTGGTTTGDGGDNTINTGSGDDTVNGGGGNDTINSGGGNDTIDGGTGADTMSGGTGDDIYFVDDAGDVVIENPGEGTDEVRTTLASYTLPDNVEILTGLNDTGQTLTGNGLRNTINGGGGDDVLNAGAPLPFSGEVIDILNGNDGSDTFDYQGGSVRANGGAGDTDTLRADFTTFNSGVFTVQSDDPDGGVNGQFSDFVDENVEFNGVERFEITGSNFDDNFVTAGGDDSISSGEGNDTITAGAGNDTVRGGNGNDTANFNVTTDGSDNVDLGAGDDVVLISGGAGQIRLTFTSAGVGNGNPNDTSTPAGDGLPNVRLQAEDGSDGLTGPQSRFDDEGITFVAGAGQTFDVRDTGGAPRGDQFKVVTLGTSGNDTQTAVSPNDSYYFNAGMGDDTVTGGTANDFLVGGGGNDTLSGAEGNDSFLGGAGNDRLTGGAGNDNLNGGDGTDTAVFSGNRADYTLVASTDSSGRVTGFTSATDNNPGNGDDGTDTLTGIEVVEFADGRVFDATDRVQLFDETGQLVGTFDDIQPAIDAASDGFTIRAGSGRFDEDLTINKDVTILGANQGIAGTGTRGNETVITGGVRVEADGVTLDGVAVIGDITGAGAAFSSGIYVTGDNFTLTNSLLTGIDGNVAVLTSTVTGLNINNNLIDNYAIGVYVSGGGSTGTINNNRFQGDGVGTATGLQNGVNSESSGVLIQNNVFDGIPGGSLNLFPFGPANVDLNSYVSGNTFTNSFPRPIQIFPTAQSLNFIGTDNNETFNGDFGPAGVANTFDGRGGDDRAFGGTGDDTFSGGEGDDRLFGGDGGDTLNGNNGDDQLFGEGGDDELNGGEGNDTLDGGTGADDMNGGGGNDTYFVDNAGDTVEDSGGIDTLNTSIAGFTIANNPDIENINNTSNADGVTTGNDNDNVITTGSGDDVINGRGGNDTIRSGDGNDTINGGPGNDDLDGQGGNDFIFGDEGNDRIRGGTGNDQMFGGSGSDLIFADDGGDDIAFGDDGDDGIYFGDELTAADEVDGGAGTLDQVALQGNYAGLTFGARNLVGIEQLVLLPGSDARFGDMSGALYSYNLTMVDENVAAGQRLVVSFNTLRAGENVTFNGAAEMDGSFLFFGGLGTDILTGGQGDDGFFFGTDGRFGANDAVDGQGGSDQLGLQGDYTGDDAITFDDDQLENVEFIVALSGSDARFGGAGTGFSYDITTSDGNVDAGETLTVVANRLQSGETLTFNGSAETDGRFVVFSGNGDDVITGGAGDDEVSGLGGDDTIRGGLGGDRLTGGDGADTFVYGDADESTGLGFDQLVGFDYRADFIDLPGDVVGFTGLIGSGKLDQASFDADLAAAVDGELEPNSAVIFRASEGSFAGRDFAVIDANGDGVYQEGEDFVFEIVNPVVPIEPTSDFFI